MDPQGVPPISLTSEPAARNPVLESLSEEDRGVLARYLSPVHRTRGDQVLTAGDTDRAMFFVLEGRAKIVRDGVELGWVTAGEHFGELGLVLGRERAANIIAEVDLSLARLGQQSWDELGREHPALALRFLRAVMGGVAGRLADMTESVGVLLRERTLPRRAEILVRVMGQTLHVRTGTAVGRLLPTEHEGQLVVAALVDNRPASSSEPLSSDCHVEPLTTGHWEGQRIYRQSLGLALLEVIGAQGVEAWMDHSVGFAARVRMHNGHSGEPVSLSHQSLQRALETLSEEKCPLREELWTLDEARAHYQARKNTSACALLETWRDRAVRMVSYGTTYAFRMGPLLPSTAGLAGFRLVPDGTGLLLMFGDLGASRRVAPEPAGDRSLPEEAEQALITMEAKAASHQTTTLTLEQERWLETLGMNSVGEFNRACVSGEVSELIQVSEGFQEKRISHIADAIRERHPRVRLVSIAGPSSSGKTTFIRRLRTQLQVNGIVPVGLSLDDYYVDRDSTPRDARGEWDFEAFEALRLDLLGAHLLELLGGAPTRTAHYDFITGKSDPTGGPEVRLVNGHVLMLEGIHGLNPKLLEQVPESQIFRVFVCPLAQLPFDQLTRVHASDVRLLRRIVRDRHGRGYSAADNIDRWPRVRAGERSHIFPFQHRADATFDTSLVYELSVLKVFAERYLLEVENSDAAYATAYRLLELLDRFVNITPNHVPPTSILREFIGGSGFEY